MSNIYAASSWRNEHQQEVVQALRQDGHAVYDFKNPAPGEKGFSWSEIDPNWRGWSPVEFREGLNHPVARHGFKRDFDAMSWANAFLVILNSGLSAHLEGGWAMGRNKPTIFYAPTIKEPELMYLLSEESMPRGFLTPKRDWFCTTLDEVLSFFRDLDTFWGIK
jgi:hypothetical protein